MPEATYHEERQPDGSTRYCCDICDWWSPQMINLQQHMNQQHQGIMIAGEPPEHPHGTPPGQDPDFVPPGQPGGSPPPGQDKPKPDDDEEEDVPHPEHPIVVPEEPVPPPPSSQAVGA